MIVNENRRFLIEKSNKETLFQSVAEKYNPSIYYANLYGLSFNGK